ncbi:MAG: M23 family metallopeptidase [Myxococcota bacterium]
MTLPFFLVLLESFAPTATAPKRTKPVTVEAPAPEVHELEWAEPLRRCGRRGRRRFCDGPRRVPLAWGEAAERAKRLGLGDTHAYNVLATRGPWDELLAEVEHDAEDTLLWPVPEGTMGRGFGYVRRQALANRLHKGVDIPAAEGSDVRAANAGIVAYADNGIVGYGNMIVLVHKNRTSTVYAHLSEARVFAGQQVERGETIGRIGRTGLTYAPHLHFEWRRGARPRNPLRRFVDRPSRERAYQLQLAMQRRRQAARRERLAARSR